MDQPQHRRKPVSEDKRERDVFLLYGSAFRDIPRLDDKTCSLPANHAPRLSSDSTLTALAQLAALRLNAGRAMISLIDGQRQYVLAEATPHISLRPESPTDASSTLWFGCVSFPRTCGLCEKVLSIDLGAASAIGDFPALVIRDLHETMAYKDLFFLKDGATRFYTGAPLLSPAGAIVGALCLFDDQPRPDGLSKEHQKIMREISESIMDHMHTYTIKDQYRRGERFTRGLVSFAEGASAIQPFKDDSERETHVDISSPEVRFDVDSSDLATPLEERSNPLDFQQQSPREARQTRITNTRRYRSMKNLQEAILPSDSRPMFARAANVMMASSDLDGVLILDASVATSQDRPQPEHSSELTSGTEGEISYQSKSSSSDEGGNKSNEKSKSPSPKACQILGHATKGIAQDDTRFVDTYGSFLEADLTRLLHDFPRGKIITFGGDGFALSSTDESPPSASTIVDNPNPSPKRKTAAGRARRNIQSVQAMLPKARSVAFVPLWDYERSRWFAGCLCWSNSNQRLLSASVDLAYLKVFSHSIMRELSSLDAIASNKAKTTFMASISHELRSPLHGILGSLEFIKDTPLDSFQSSMLNSLNACGQTLLDTINHVMDHAKISETRRRSSSRKLKDTNTVRLTSKLRKNRKPQTGAFNLAIATEEVVEAVFSASSYVPISSPMLDLPGSSSDSGAEETAKRKICFVVLNIAQDGNEDWTYNFPVGSWKRIVMNIFGNAIKYTESGYISVSLRVNNSSKAAGALSTVTLSITDTGIGMSPQFLANKAFQPFSQENSFAPGTGLGLSIVNQIIETNGGKIEVSSDLTVGTKIVVKLALARPESVPSTSSQRNQFLSLLPRFEGRRICILHRNASPSTVPTSVSPSDEGLTRFSNSLATTLENHLKMHVVRTSKWDGHESDIVIVPELSFEYLTAIRRARLKGGRAPVTVFVAMDALEAATLRSDARVQNKESVVEIMTQPCGPYKLAFVLNQCLNRFALPEENIPAQVSAVQSPQPAESTASKREWLTAVPLHLSNAPNHFIPQIPPAQIPSTEPLSFSNVRTVPQEQSSSTASFVLIVDDNAINRKLLIAFMKKYDYQYEEAEDGRQALEAYCLASPKFTVILMDMSMPVMDGMTSTRAIREYEQSNNLPRCRIVALTGLASASARLEALNSGVDNFLTKPVNFKILSGLMKREDQRRKSINAGEASGVVLGREDDKRLADVEEETEGLEEEKQESTRSTQQERVEKASLQQEQTNGVDSDDVGVQLKSEEREDRSQG